MSSYSICIGEQSFDVASKRPEAEQKAKTLSYGAVAPVTVSLTYLARDPSEVVLSVYQGGKRLESYTRAQALAKTTIRRS